MGKIFNTICLTLTHLSSSKSPLEVLTKEKLPSNSSRRLPRLLRTLELSALERREPENLESLFTSRALNSIELLMASWPREVISLPETELEVNQFMEKSSTTRTLPRSTLAEVSSPWLTLAKTPTDLNSSSASELPLISTVPTSCLDNASMLMASIPPKFLMLLKATVLNLVQPKSLAASLTAVNLTHEENLRKFLTQLSVADH